MKVYGGTDPLTGREIRLRKICRTERAAQIELGKLLEQAEAGRQPETNATVAELMDQYAAVADWDLSRRKASGSRPAAAIAISFPILPLPGMSGRLALTSAIQHMIDGCLDHASELRKRSQDTADLTALAIAVPLLMALGAWWWKGRSEAVAGVSSQEQAAAARPVGGCNGGEVAT